MTKKNAAIKSLLIAAGISVTLVPALALAKGDRGGHRASFETLDTDGNGEITQAEMAAHAASRFADADTDGDGMLSLEELSAKADERRAKRIERMLSHRDADGDGMLSPEELAPDPERLAKRFERVDADKSGGISKAEYEEIKKKRRHHRSGDN